MAPEKQSKNQKTIHHFGATVKNRLNHGYTLSLRVNRPTPNDKEINKSIVQSITYTFLCTMCLRVTVSGLWSVPDHFSSAAVKSTARQSF